MIRTTEQATRSNPSRPRLCADVLLASPFSRYYKTLVASSNWPMFRFNYDLECGYTKAAELILLGEDEIVGISEAIDQHMIQQNIYDPQGAYSTLGDSYSSAKKEATTTAGLLRQDPTGLAVMEYALDALQNEDPWSPSWQSRTYVVAGAELARDVYKALYRISCRLKPSSQEK